MKHKSNAGPGLIVALGAPSDDAGKMGITAHGDASGGANLDAESQADNVDTVPLDALSMPDDQEQMQPPEVGDVVNYQVTGKVAAIEGNQAKIQRTSINGQELPGADDENANNENPQDANQDEDGDDASGLRQQAAGIGMLS